MVGDCFCIVFSPCASAVGTLGQAFAISIGTVRASRVLHTRSVSATSCLFLTSKANVRACVHACVRVEHIRADVYDFV